MTIHRYHPDPDRHDPPDALLFDDCERCTEHAEQIVSLDTFHLQTLLAVHICGDWAGHVPTRTEAQALQTVWRALLIMERLAGPGADWRVLIGAEGAA
jgi:hypothetical protein